MLITLFFRATGTLSQPLLYLSGFFDTHRNESFRRLLAVSREGDWRGWIEFFLRGVKVQAQLALADTRRSRLFVADELMQIMSGKSPAADTPA